MKLIFAILISAVSAASAASINLRGAPQQPLSSGNGVDFSLGVNASFTLDTGNELTAEEAMFAKYCIRRAYNSVHDPNALVMMFTDIVDEQKTPIPGAMVQNTVSLDGKYQPFNWVLGAATSGVCRLCHARMGQLETRSGSTGPSAVAFLEFQLRQGLLSWELALCEKLRSGSFETFHTISNCTISIFLPETGNNNGVQDVQMGVTSHFTSPYDQDLSTNEQLFANECLRLSYNEVHDPATAFMDKTDFKNQTYLGAAKTKYNKAGPTTNADAGVLPSLAWSLEWDTQASFLNVNAHDDDSSNSVMKKSASAVFLEQQHNRWQMGFCEKLRSGPFGAFQSVENCQIVVDGVTPLFAAQSKSVLKN